MKKYTRGDIIFNTILYLFMAFIVVITLYPFLNVLAISFNDSMDSVKGGISIWPRKFTFDNYSQFFDKPDLLTGLRNSVLRTLIGTGLGVISSAMLAFTFSRKDFIARRFFSGMFVITMYISGGIIPSYMLITQIGLIDNFWVYIVPGLISIFNVLIIRSFMDSLPYSLQESAQIDGANDLVIFIRIILPLCMPALATVTLFIAVFQWNNWFDTYLYASNNQNLTTLQYELMKILQSSQSSVSASDANNTMALSRMAKTISPQSTKMAITIIATVPILMVYPFVQKYFVQGMTLGAVKS